MKKLFLFMLLLIGICVCSGCASKDNALEGSWMPKRIKIERKIYRLDELKGIKDLYSLQILSVNRNGTFSFSDAVFRTDGKWVSTWKEGSKHAYLFKSETVSRLTITDGKLIVTDEQPKFTQYTAWITNDDPNTLVWSDPNSKYLFYFERVDKKDKRKE